jgi:predicted metal-dependent enzyme (double-stranded beta helix superfamily)
MPSARALPNTAFIAPIERALKNDRVTALARVLAELNAANTFDDPGFFSPPRTDRYARRLLWRDRDDRFIVVAMTWAPGQCAQLHDHGGLWGAEIVVGGTMRESSFRVVERNGTRAARFVREPDVILTERTVGILVPPLEYHAYANAGAAVSHTLHVYAGPLETCIAYTPAAGDWWTGEERALHYDA